MRAILTRALLWLLNWIDADRFSPERLFEKASEYLPRYLSDPDKRQMYRDLLRGPVAMPYYIVVNDPDPLQGDGWSGVRFVTIQSGQTSPRRVIVVSNSCDIAAANERLYPMNLCVSPLIRISRMRQAMLEGGASVNEVEDFFASVRKQDVSNMFYLPPSNELPEESVVCFDELQSQSSRSFRQSDGKARMFTLSQAAAWYFALKLSIHFCRLTDGVRRL